MEKNVKSWRAVHILIGIVIALIPIKKDSELILLMKIFYIILQNQNS